ncbi:MAG: hypothetical protein ACFFAO_07495 [Candidatus Hermodarchaeota archaeon]
MAKVKGKFITFAGRLMTLYKDEQQKAEDALYAKTGKRFGELEPEGWYSTRIIDAVLKAYAKASPTGRNAIVTMGRNVYPIINRTVGIPPEKIKTPLDAIMFETENYLDDHQSDEDSQVIPRKIISADDGHVVIEGPAPGYDPILYKGVYLGILQMLGIKTGKVEMIDEKKAIFDITW